MKCSGQTEEMDEMEETQAAVLQQGENHVATHTACQPEKDMNFSELG